MNYLKTQKYYFGKFDHQLDDKPYGECYLKKPEVAQIVKDKLHELDGQFYKLMAYCIMPNHVHLLLDFSVQLKNEDDNYVELWKVLKRIKGGTAVVINRLVGRTGAFWQRDSYDRVMRNGKEAENVINYILDNPLKAGLVKRREDFEHSYSHDEFI